MSNEIKIELLWNCAKALKNGQQTHKLLRSYYINICRKLAKNNLQVPKEKFALSQMCSYCGSFWNESAFELKSLPKQLKLSSKEKKLIENYKNRDGCGKILNRTQKNRAKWLMKKTFKRISIKCQQCNHKSFMSLENKKNKSPVLLPKNEKNEESAVLKKCNKYKEDEFKQKEGHIEPQSEKKKRPEKEKPLICNNKTQANRSSTNKVISNTQKQNSLLQLAALLQKQSNVDLKNSSHKKLQTLLK